MIKIKIGIIGYGSMGSMLLKGFINNKSVEESDIYISIRSKDKIDMIKSKYKNVNIILNNSDVAKYADILFVCVKPMDFKNVLKEVKENIKKETHIISISSCITIEDIEKIIDGKITKVIPSITSEVNEGISLVCSNKNVKTEDKEVLNYLLNSISIVKYIEEKNFEIGADLTSCAPGLFATIFNEYVEESLKHGSLTAEESIEMVIETLYGTIKLMKEQKIGFEEVLSRVATKGGITEEGAIVLRNRLPDVFKETFEATLSKHEIIKDKIRDK